MVALMLFLSLLLSPLVVQAQPFTWTPLDIRETEMPLAALLIRGLTPDGSLLGSGRFFDFRILPDHTTVTPITCPNIARDTTQLRRGPTIQALNLKRTVVGEEAIVQGGVVRGAGILQLEDSPDCVLVQRPGAVNTRLLAISDDGTAAGVSQGPNVSLGLRRFAGFTYRDGVFTTLAGACNTDAAGTVTAEVLTPEAIATGWVVGYGYCNLQPTNAYRYEAFFCQDGHGCQTLRDPDGHTLWLAAVTNEGLAYGSQATSEFVPTGKAYQIDLRVEPKTFTELELPPATTAGGTVLACHPTAAGPQGYVCEAREQLASCPPPDNPFVNCVISVQWLGLYPPPVQQESPTKDKKLRDKERPDKDRRNKERAK